MDTKKLRQKILDLAIHGKLVPNEEGWKDTTLGDVCDFVSGYVYPSDSYQETGTPLVRISNIKDGYIDLNKCAHIDSDKYTRNIVVEKGDLLIAMSGATTGKMGVYHNDEKAILNQRVGSIKVKNENILTKEFRNYAVLFLKKKIEELAYGGAQPNVSSKMICSLPIHLPPLAEQQRIVAKIEELFAQIDIIEQSETALEEAKAKAHSKILDLAFSGKLVPKTAPWHTATLEDITEYEQPQKYIVESTDYADFYKTPVLTPGKSFILGYTNEVDGIFKDVPVIIFDDFTTESRYVDFPFKVKSSAMKILHVKSDVDIKYVAFFMSITRLVGKTHKRYWISEYSKLPIPLPPLAEQKRIVAKIEELFELLK